MLPPNVAASTDRLAESAVNCAWRQWAVIGGAVLEAPTRTDALVDPEALVLGSLALARREPRLAEVMEDWCVLNSRMLSTGRLAVLRDRFDEEPVDGLRLLAGTVADEAKDRRWLSLSDPGAPRPKATRSLRTPRRRQRPRQASSPIWSYPQTWMLRLRLGFGMGAKSDILTILLARPKRWLQVSELIKLSGYAASPVRRAVEDMHQAGFVGRKKVGPRETAFGIMNPERWDSVLWDPLRAGAYKRDRPIRWQRWSDAYGFLSRWLGLLDRIPVKRPTAFALAVEAQKAMESDRSFWHELGIPFDGPEMSSGTDAWVPVDSALQRLESAFNGE